MFYTALGDTGITVSALCFGSLTLGPLQNNLPVDEGSALLANAFEAGINFVDTAQLYKTYPYIKNALTKFSGDVVIASKTYAYTREQARDAFEEARRELDRDYVDIFLLHEQESDLTLRGHAQALDYLYEQKAKGRIRAVGLSTHAVAGVFAAVEARLDVVHPLINIAGLGITDGYRKDMEAAVAMAKSAGLGVYTMKALGGGNLYSKASEALAYAIGRGHSVAVGMKNQLELEANLRFFETGRFTTAEEKRLFAQTRQNIIEDHCTGCLRCMASCPAKALHPQGGRVVCDSEACILCGYCAAQCENFCIKMI